MLIAFPWSTYQGAGILNRPLANLNISLCVMFCSQSWMFDHIFDQWNILKQCEIEDMGFEFLHERLQVSKYKRAYKKTAHFRSIPSNDVSRRLKINLSKLQSSEQGKLLHWFSIETCSQSSYRFYTVREISRRYHSSLWCESLTCFKLSLN